MRQALLINIWQLSAIFLLASSPLGRHTFSGFSRNIWLGSSSGSGWATQGQFTELSLSHFFCVLTSIVLLEGKPSGRLRFWMLWTMFSLRPSLYFCVLSISSTLMSPSVPASEKQPHSMRLLPAHFTFGMVIRMWWAVPAFLQTWCLELRLIRPDNIIS